MTDMILQPDNIALIVVGASPMWLSEHTCLAPKPDLDHVADALVTKRIADLMWHFGDNAGRDTPWPYPITVESGALERLSLRGLMGRVLGLAGVFGDLCVFDVARKLKRRGWPVVIIEDACLWSSPLEGLIDPKSEAYVPALAKFPRVRATTLWPLPTMWSYWTLRTPAHADPASADSPLARGLGLCA